jgi:hypothetical protein
MIGVLPHDVGCGCIHKVNPFGNFIPCASNARAMRKQRWYFFCTQQLALLRLYMVANGSGALPNLPNEADKACDEPLSCERKTKQGLIFWILWIASFFFPHGPKKKAYKRLFFCSLTGCCVQHGMLCHFSDLAETFSSVTLLVSLLMSTILDCEEGVHDMIAWKGFTQMVPAQMLAIK